jgi:hypothetical protein
MARSPGSCVVESCALCSYVRHHVHYHTNCVCASPVGACCGPFQQQPQSLPVAACLTPSEVLRFTLHGRLLGDAAAIQRYVHVAPETMDFEKLMPAIH